MYVSKAKTVCDGREGPRVSAIACGRSSLYSSVNCGDAEALVAIRIDCLRVNRLRNAWQSPACSSSGVNSGVTNVMSFELKKAIALSNVSQWKICL